MIKRRTILLYSRSGAGKTTQLGELAEKVYKETGKKSLIYTIDKGGTAPLIPYIELDIIDLVECGDTDPMIFANKAVTGQIRDPKGGWMKAPIESYGMVAFESMTSFSDAFMNLLAEKSAQGVNIGGAANVSLNIVDGAETLKIGGNNMGHYNVAQTRILSDVWKSQKLPVPFIVWTASASKEDDANSTTKVVGPQLAGKALTAEMPRHFDLTFRMDFIPAQSGKDKRHILYLGPSLDITAGNALSLGNTRTPLGSKPLPPTVEPASIVKALTLIEEAEKEATALIKQRLAIKPM